MGIVFAQTVLVLWIPFTFYVFQRYPLPRAACFCFLTGMLVLPTYVQVKLPLCPGFDKYGTIHLAMVLAVWRFAPKHTAQRVERWWYFATAGTMFASFMSGYTNQEPLFYGPLVIPGHGFKDDMFLVLSDLLTAAPASYLGMRCFREARDLKLIVRMLAVSGLIYSLPTLVEVRMSPQVHRWIYGYGSPHEWSQTIRWGGYRPMVMLGHGLVLSLFMLGPTMASTALARTGGRVWKLSASTASWFLIAILGICKSTGVWFYAALVLPMVRWSRAQSMVRFATVLAVITCLYPWLRANHYVPIEKILDYAGRVGEDRQQSLDFRFDNEEILLAKAMLRPWFGWGGYGRARVYDDQGVDICVTDGWWILVLGTSGFVGFFFTYLFSVVPIFAVRKRVPLIRDADLRNLIASLILMCAVMWFDGLPNSPGFFLVQFFGGALCSICRGILEEQRRKPEAPADPTTDSRAERVPHEPAVA